MIFRRRVRTEVMLANAERNRTVEDEELDPDDPVVRLVRQARAHGDERIRCYLGETTMTCPTCLQCTQRPVYAHSPAVSREYAIPVATYCTNCPPGEEDE